MNGLWIRSQDKNALILCEDIEIAPTREFFDLRANSSKDYFKLGTYKTKERASQVLDEMAQHIRDLDIMHNGGFNVHVIPVVYQMPEE